MKKLLLLLPLVLLLAGCSNINTPPPDIGQQNQMLNSYKTNVLLECILQGDKKCCNYYLCE